MRYKSPLEAGAHHDPYFNLKFLWEFPTQYMAVTARAVSFKFLGFLPPDVCVDPMWAITLVRKLARHQAEVVGSRVVAEDGTLEHAGVKYQLGPFNLHDVPLPEYYLRGYPGGDLRALRDGPMPSVSKVAAPPSCAEEWEAPPPPPAAPHRDALGSPYTAGGGGVPPPPLPPPRPK